jgi:hypothetical protein
MLHSLCNGSVEQVDNNANDFKLAIARFRSQNFVEWNHHLNLSFLR